MKVIPETRRAHSISKGHNTTEKTDMNDPKCQWGATYEDSIHYLMECPLYQNERYCLFRNLRETNENIETLLFGNDEISMNENSNIFNKVRAYIRQTKRF